jgi:hypothetical protein
MQTHLRPARPGDICVLLAPSAEETLQVVRPRQLYLQRLFGGEVADFVHLTCQRFLIQDEWLPNVVQQLRTQGATIQPFSMVATSLVQWRAGAGHGRSLRWGIALTRDLRRVGALISGVLAKTGAAPLYAAGWHSTMVIALEDINELTIDPNFLADQSFPFPLFMAQQLVLTRIKAIGQYETLDTIPLGA